MRAVENLVGRKVGFLTVLKESHRDSRGVWWWCGCECGNAKQYPTSRLNSGHVFACGCKRGAHLPDVARTHGKSNTPTYESWQAMIARCRGKRGKSDKWYAAKGIKVCERWKEPRGRGFANFLSDMGERPAGKSLDRIDNDKDYEPSNCRWATWREQAVNRSNVVLYEYMGKKLSISDWVREITGRQDIIVRVGNQKRKYG